MLPQQQVVLDGGQNRQPGTVVKTTVTISILAVIVIVGTPLMLLFILKPEWRPVIIFVASVLAGSGTIASAFYAVETVRIASRNILITSDNINRGIRDRRISESFRFMERWNSPSLSEIKSKGNALIKEMRDKTDDQKRKMLEEDLGKRAIMVDIFNFFEEMAIAIKNQIVDERILKDFFRGLISIYFNTAEPWAKSHRTIQPRALIEVELLSNRWR